MATAARIAANRRNAAGSTGPRTVEGKARSARNALKHGLAGLGVAVPDEMIDAIRERTEAVRDAERPANRDEEWLVERIGAEMVRIEHATIAGITEVAESARRAAETWDEDRAEEAERLGDRLPRRPERVLPRLLRTKHGVDWLVDAWEDLDRRVARDGLLTGEIVVRACDLLGIPLDDRGGAAVLDVFGAPTLDGWRSLVDERLADLRRRLESYLIDRDERARARAEHGLDNDDPEVRRARRYESELCRRLWRWQAELRRLQGPDRPPAAPVARNPRADADAPRPSTPTQRPAPEPDRSPDRPPDPASRPPAAPDRSAAPTAPKGTVAGTIRETICGPSPALSRRERRRNARLQRG